MHIDISGDEKSDNRCTCHTGYKLRSDGLACVLKLLPSSTVTPPTAGNLWSILFNNQAVRMYQIIWKSPSITMLSMKFKWAKWIDIISISTCIHHTYFRPVASGHLSYTTYILKCKIMLVVYNITLFQGQYNITQSKRTAIHWHYTRQRPLARRLVTILLLRWQWSSKWYCASLLLLS